MAAAPADIRLTEMEAALAAAPVWEKQVLEIGLQWPEFSELSTDQQWAASRLRTFLLTWDPFEWQPDRGAAFATSTTRSGEIGLVLYVPHWRALALAGDPPDGRALAAGLGRLGESILGVAGEYRTAIVDGSYPAGAQSGARPRLLSRIPAEGVLEPPSLTVVGPGWQPIQFDVLEDLAQDGFGPADLDRSPVRFQQPGEGRPGCPGCSGQALGFPDGLKDAQEAICGPHRSEALRITSARLEASKASNPAGWEALLDAGQRLVEPHLPNGLGPRLVAAALSESPPTSDVAASDLATSDLAASDLAASDLATSDLATSDLATSDLATSDLAAQAALVVGAASIMAGLPDPQTALGGRIAPVRSWLERLPDQLAAQGMGEEATQVTAAAQELLAAPAAAAVAAAADDAAAAVAEVKPQPYRRGVRVGRNAPCPCGSGKKYKFCHGTGG